MMDRGTVRAEGPGGDGRSLAGGCVAAALVLAALAGCAPGGAEWQREAVSEPTVFAPGIISGELRDYDISFTPDGAEAYFTRRGRRGPSSILVSRYQEGEWTEAERASFSVDRDAAPFVTADGSALYFASRRGGMPGAEDSEDIWVTLRGPDGDGWQAPAPVQGPVNRPGESRRRYEVGTESGPTLLPDGSLLYWSRVDTEWGSDLYVAPPGGELTFGEPRPLRLNSHGEESNPALSPDGRFLVFQGYRDPDAVGGEDLYVVGRTRYGWTDPVLLPAPINTSDNEGWPSFSPDGRHFFFASDRERSSGMYDIYWVDVEALGLPDEASTDEAMRTWARGGAPGEVSAGG